MAIRAVTECWLCFLGGEVRESRSPNSCNDSFGASGSLYSPLPKSGILGSWRMCKSRIVERISSTLQRLVEAASGPDCGEINGVVRASRGASA